MAQVINTNVGALFAGAALNRSANALQVAQARLSSGLRINSARDDATGLAIAAGYDGQIRGANVMARNAADGISLAQISEGYLAQVQENTLRLREIFVQTGDVTNEEAVALIDENDRLSSLTVGSVAVDVDEAGGTAGGSATAFTAASSFSSISDFDTEIDDIAAARAAYGADMAQLASAVAGLQSAAVNLSASFSRIMDTDYAAETTAMTRNMILQQAGTAVLAQANQTPNTVLTLLR